MRLVFLAGLLAATLPALAQPASPWLPQAEALSVEIDGLRQRLDIPGLAMVVVHDGEAIYRSAMGTTRNGRPFATDTPLRIASVTKSLTAVLIMQAVENGELALTDPVTDYLPDYEGSPETTIYHLLTHTSEGRLGAEFVYSTMRYARLADILAAATGRPFESMIRERIMQVAGMRWYPSPNLGAHAGLVSTADGLAAYARALDQGLLLSAAMQQALMSPQVSVTTHDPLPVGLGWFSQTVQGVRVVWSFGQDDPDHSGALLLRLPDLGFTFVLLANANVLSDPFRLLMGDVRLSPFAMACIRLFAFSPAGAPLAAPDRGTELAEQLDLLERASPYRFAEELTGHLLVDIRRGDRTAARATWDLLTSRYPAYAREPNGGLLIPLLQSQDPAMTAAAVAMGERLLPDHPLNRWILWPMAMLYENAGEDDRAIALYERILVLPDQAPDFLHALFQAWAGTGLGRLWAERDPEKARAYLEEVLKLDVEDEAEEARALLERLDGR
ncbi:MAG: serine hydrolase [Rhodothermales bacterium]